MPLIINDNAIAALRAKGAKPVSGRGKLTFPTQVPAPWAKLPGGTVLTAKERGDELVAIF